MFHKKILLILLPLIFLGNCSLKPEVQKSDFVGMYQSHVKDRISSLRDIAKDMGYMESYTTNGTLRMLANIPMILSGALSTSYDAKVHSQDLEMTFMNPSASYETFLASGSVIAKEISMITSGGSDVFFRYQDLKEIWLMDQAIVTLFEKYNNTWLSLKESDMEDTLSGSTEEDIRAYRLSQTLSRMTLSDIEKYLLKYPLWKEQKDLGMSGSLHTFEVTLARENIVAMIWEFTREATNDLTPEAKKDLEMSLADIQMTGTLTLDPSDMKRASFDGTMTFGSGSTPVRMILDETASTTLMSLSASGNALNIAYRKTETGYESSLALIQDGQEMARLEGTIKKDDKNVHTLNMTFYAPAQWLTVTLENRSNPDGTFDGKLNAGIGNMSWKGKLEPNKGISDLHVTWAMIGSSLSLDLTPAADGMLRGPMLVKSGDATLISADIGLIAKKEEFTLIVDVANPDDAKVKSHGEISITARRAPWSGTINIPKDTKKFKDFASEISALSPKEDPFIEQPFDTNSGISTSKSWASPIEIPSK